MTLGAPNIAGRSGVHPGMRRGHGKGRGTKNWRSWLAVIAVAALVAMLLPATASAQRRRQAGGGGREQKDTSALTDRDVVARLAALNPVGLLLQNRDSLSLSEDQVTSLMELNRRFRERERPLVVTLDSVARKNSDGWVPASQSAVRDTALSRLVNTVGSAQDSALAMLSANQLRIAKELIARDQRLRERPQHIGVPVFMGPGATPPP